MDSRYKKDLICAINNDVIIFPIVKDIFEQADVNHKGYIEKKELESCMLKVAGQLGCSKPDKDAIDAEFKKLDVNDDGVVDIKEFSVFIRKTLLEIVENL